jgi:Raf kinase inhibitor-like YbhB/YbcL family protein
MIARFCLLLLAVAPGWGCASGGLKPSTPPGVALASITVTSKAFTSNGPIPIDNSCDGKDLSPHLTWSSPPAGTRSLAILLEDPDAPGNDFTHWIVFNLSPEARMLAEAADPTTLGARLGTNDFPDVAYRGPCPPRGEMHRYVFHVFALDQSLSLQDGANRAAIDAAMNGHVLGEGTLIGMFGH